MLRPDPASSGQTRECQKLAPNVVESQSEKDKALEAPKETPEKYKGLRQLLGTVVAELAVVAILI